MTELPSEQAQVQPVKNQDASSGNEGHEKDPELESRSQLQGRPGLGDPPRRVSNLPKRGLDTSRFLSMRIPAAADAHHTATETHGHDHWKVNLLNFIHSDTVERVLMGLLLLDVFLLFIELFLQATYPMCHIIERDAISCCAINNATIDHEASAAVAADHGEDEHHFLRFLSSEEHGDHHNLCISPAVESYQYEAACDPHKWGTVHKLEEALFWCTISILSVFFIELMAMIVVLERAFFRQFFYVLDLWIVTTSLVLELAFHFISAETLVAFTGILVFGRLWRFVRIGESLLYCVVEKCN
jgi:hypothetical protein